jgi:hypothetical protein
MKYWPLQYLTGMSGSHIYSGPNIRIHVMEISPEKKVKPFKIGRGEMLINVLVGSGTLCVGGKETHISQGDQALIENDESFTLWCAQSGIAFIVQMLWVPGISAEA